MMIKVSVILTSFNHSKTLRKTIDGVLAQTLEDFELIIWDDASKDDSWDIINSYDDCRIRKFRNSENKNGVHGLNEAITKVCKGKYIAIHHSGDGWKKDKLQKQYDFLELNSDVGAAFTNVEVVDEKGNKLSDQRNFYFDIFNQPNRTQYEWFKFFLTKGNALCHPSVMIRKKCFDDIGIYKVGLVQTADFDMWVRLVLNYNIHILDEKLTVFSVDSNGSNSSSHSTATEVRSNYECYNIFNRVFEQIDYEFFRHSFPELNLSDCNSVDEEKFLIARSLIDIDTIKPVKLSSLDSLFTLLQSEQSREMLENKYDFNINSFSTLSFSVDSFNVLQLIKEKEKFNVKEAELLKLKNENVELEKFFTNSLSWKVTKPLRVARTLLTNPRFYLPRLKKSWFFPYLRAVYIFYSSAKYHLKNVINSTQNLRYSRSVASERNSTLCAPWHISKLEKYVHEGDLPSITVSVVTFNSEKWVESFENSLVNQNYPLSKINLHFVDNGSEDPTVELLENFSRKYSSAFASINVHKRANYGFGAGHDYAIKNSEDEFVLITNIDLEFTSDALVRVIKSALLDNVDVASWEMRQVPYEHPKFYDPITFETAWSSHACVVLRRSAYLDVGGYDERIFMYGEDVELSYRLRAFGYKLRYVPSAHVFHYTYDEVNQVKPLQFSGSTLANAYIRLRYGNNIDRFVGIGLQMGLLVRGAGFKGSRKLVLKNFLKIASNFNHFINKYKIDRNVFFPFRGFDYEKVRDGAFFDLTSTVRNENLPLVTIVTRTYKGREYWLKECISSVINQTYHNIQHIIVEDGGDTHKEKLESISNAYSQSYKLDFYPLEKRGRSFAGNYGLEQAEGKYCLFLDDDDILFPDHVELLVSALENDNSHSAAYSLAWDMHTESLQNEQGQVTGYLEHSHETLPLFYQEFCRDTLFKYNYIPIQAILFKKELYSSYGGFEEDMDQLEDWNLWTKYAINSSFKYIPKTTSLFRTPHEKYERLRRARMLDDVFEDAIQRQKELIKNHG